MGDACHQSFEQVSTTEEWANAVAGLREADTKFIPVRKAFSDAERVCFLMRKSGNASALTQQALAAAEAELAEATERERIYGNALFEASRHCFYMPAPSIAAVIEKLELIEMFGHDGSVEQLILADLRRLCRPTDRADRIDHSDW